MDRGITAATWWLHLVDYDEFENIAVQLECPIPDDM